MSEAFGRALFSGVQGALGGAEQYIQQEREFERKMTLEEYRRQGQMEAERLREAYTRDIADQRNALGVYGKNIEVEEAAKERDFKREESEKEWAARERIANTTGAGPNGRLTEAARKRVLGVAFNGILQSGQLPETLRGVDGWEDLKAKIPAFLEQDPTLKPLFDRMIAIENGVNTAGDVTQAESYIQSIIQSIGEGGPTPNAQGPEKAFDFFDSLGDFDPNNPLGLTPPKR